MTSIEPDQTTDRPRPPRSHGIRVLVVVLLAQLVVSAVLIYFALAGWPWVPDAPATGARAAVAQRFLPGAAGDGVPTPTGNKFDQDHAFSLLRRQVNRFGWRPAGSSASRRLAEDLRRRLPAGRLERFRVGKLQLNNVVGVIPGRKPAILVAAHYDVVDRPKRSVGANDGAAGSAAVVELARALAAAPLAEGTGRELRFVLFDGEEAPAGSVDFLTGGLRGSKDYARRHGNEIASMVLLDYIANRGLQLPREASSNRSLWKRLRAAAQRSGTLAAFPDATQTAVYDDHTPVPRQGCCGDQPD